VASGSDRSINRVLGDGLAGEQDFEHLSELLKHSEDEARDPPARLPWTCPALARMVATHVLAL
jgi:hypothetical protein